MRLTLATASLARMSGSVAGRAARPPRTPILRWLDRGEEMLGVALLVVLGVFLTAQVVMRFVLGLGYSWMEEIIRMLFIWVIFLGAVAAMRRNLHIRVEAGLLLFPAAAASARRRGSATCCCSASASR